MKLRYIAPLLLGLFVSASVSAQVQHYERGHSRADQRTRVDHRPAPRHVDQRTHYRQAEYRPVRVVRSAPVIAHPAPVIVHPAPVVVHPAPVVVRKAPAYYVEPPYYYSSDNAAAVFIGAIIGGVIASELTR